MQSSSEPRDADAPRAVRVLVVVSSTDRRGAESAGVTLGALLTDRGWPARVVALAPGRQGGLGLPVLGRKRRSVRTLVALRRAARAADVVIAFGSTAVPACGLAMLGSPTPFVYRNIGDPRVWHASWTRRSRSRLAIGRAAATAALCVGAERELRARFGAGADIEVIPNGVSVTHFRPPVGDERTDARARFAMSGSAPVVAYVGALTEEKRVGDIITAVASLPRVRLLVAGDGPCHDDLERRAAAALGARARFAGSLADARQVYWAADLVVLASRTEGVPAVLIEAGMCGVPTVATDVGFVREIVIDGVTGIIVPPARPELLGRAVASALRESDALGEAARTKCSSDFDADQLVARWEQLLIRVALAH